MQLPDFSKTKVLVTGDVMLDRYWSGPTNRISPEAPVPVLKQADKEDRLGGAANVALNLASLGVGASLSGAMGQDAEGDALSALLQRDGIANQCLRSEQTVTITKLRLMSRNQQLLRVDNEEAFSGDVQKQVIEQTLAAVAGKAAVVLSDYGKGTFADPQPLIKACRVVGIPVLVDPKGNSFDKYKSASVLTPNLGEFRLIVGDWADDHEMQHKAEKLRQQLDLDALIVTMGSRGMLVVEAGLAPLQLPTRAREVFDVTGAGDTVIAVLAACLGARASIAQAASLANLAAGLVVGKLGTASVSRSELETALYLHSADRGQIAANQSELLQLVHQARLQGERIVMTNGCFDLLHPGHLACLQEAASEGDRLIVAVNDDDSVRRLKGPHRPINPLEDRLRMLVGLKGVDWVCPFSEDTPEQLIASVLPDVLIKGGDYRPEAVAGYRAVTEAGGQVKVVRFLDGYSSSSLIERLQGRDG